MIKQRNRIHNKFQLQRSLSNFTKMLFFRLSWWLDLNIYKTCGWIQLKNAQKKIKTTANEIFIFLTLWRKKYRSFQNLRFGDLKIILYRLTWINLNYIYWVHLPAVLYTYRLTWIECGLTWTILSPPSSSSLYRLTWIECGLTLTILSPPTSSSSCRLTWIECGLTWTILSPPTSSSSCSPQEYSQTGSVWGASQVIIDR